MNKYRSHNCLELNESNSGIKVLLSGWLHRKRDHGNLLFIDLRDHFGITQCVIENNTKYIKLIKYHFKLIQNVKNIDFRKNFVLSALNLAFLGAYMDNKVKLYKHLIHWPDGVFIKNINIYIKKIPGRDILKELRIPKKIKKITVLGSLPDISKKFLEFKQYIELSKFSFNEFKAVYFFPLNRWDILTIDNVFW